MNWISVLLDQAGTAAPAAPTGGFDGLMRQLFQGGGSLPLMMALMFGIMYFVLIRPQGQEKKKLEAAIEKLQKGDRVLTTSGIIATVVTVDKTRAVLRINDDVKVEFVRSAIAQVLPADKS